MSRKQLSNKKSTQMKVSKSELSRLERQVLNDIMTSNSRKGVIQRRKPSNSLRRGQAKIQKNLNVGVSAAYAQPGFSSKPQIRNGDNTCRVVHRELLSNILSNPNTSLAWLIIQSYALNPGLATTFPWLANIAMNWERYRFNKLRFVYLPRCATSTNGSVSLIPDYDAADSAPQNEQVASSLQNMREDAVWKQLTIDLDPSSMHAIGPSKFVRTGALQPNLDIKTYDSGNLFVAVADNASPNIAFGKLWIEYDVTFMTPQLPTTGQNSVVIQPISGASSTNPLGTSQVIVGPLGATVSGTSLTLSNLLPGAEYVFNNVSAGTGITAAPRLLSIVDNLGNAVTLKNGPSNLFNAAATASSSYSSFLATTATMVATLAATATTISSGTVGTTTWIDQLPPAAPI